MGTRGWTLSTFVGCCIWILHGLRAAAAIPVTTEGLFAPITAESEGPRALVMGTAETSTVVADAEIAESILAGSPASPSFPPGAEPDALVTAASEYGSTVPTLMNVTEPLNVSQYNERGSAAPIAATTTAAISAQHPAVTPEAELDVTGAAPDAPLGTTPFFADVKEDVLTAVIRGGAEDLDPTTPPPAATWGAQPTAGSPVGAGVTALVSQGLTTATGAVEEGVTLPVDIQSEASANSSSPSPGTGGLLTTQQDGAVSGAVGITPEPAGETAPAAEESPSASVPGDAGDTVNGAFSTVGSSRLPLESTTVSGTVGNPGEPSLLPGQAALSPAASLAPAGGEDGDGQGAPGMTSDTPSSAALLAASEAPAVTGDMATSLLGPRVPTDAQSDMNPPAPATTLPAGDVEAVGLAEPSLQPVPWQSPTGEQPPLLATALPSPTDTPSSPGAAYPPPGAGTLPAADDGAETPVSPDLGVAPGATVSPFLKGSQPWGTAADAPQGADGPSSGLNSASDAPNPASFVPDGLAWPAAGVPAQGAEGAGEMAQAGGPGDGSPYADTKSDVSPSAFSTQQDPTNTGELPDGGTGALTNAELSSPSVLGDGAEAGAVPALGQVSPPGPAHPGSTGLEPNLSGAEGPGGLVSESPSTPGAAYPPPGAVAVPVSGPEAPASPDLGAAQGAPVSPSLGGSQPWGTAAGAPQGAGVPGVNLPGTGLTSAWDTPSSAAYGPAGPPSPALGDQLGTNLGLPGEEGLGAGTAEQALGGAGSGTGFEPSLISSAGSGMAAGVDQLPGAGSSSGPASPGDLAAASSVSEGDGAAPIPAAASGPDSLSPASLDSATGPELAPMQGPESAGDAAQSGNPEGESPYMETSPSAISTQQDPVNIGELPAGGTGALVNAELSPLPALGDGAEAGVAPALGQVSPPGPARPGSAGLEPDLLGAEGPGSLVSESPSTPGAAYPPPGAVAVPVSGPEAPASPDLGAAQGAPVSPSLGGSQPWGTAAGAPQGAGVPGVNLPGTGLTSAWDTPSSAAYGPAGPPSPALGDQLGTNLGLPAAGGQEAGTAEQALGGAGSGTGFEPSPISTAGSGTAAGVDQQPGAGFSSGPASPGDLAAASSVSEGDGAAPIPAAASGPDSLSPASLDSATGPELAPMQGAESAGEAAQSGNPEGESPYMETSPSAISTQQDPANIGELPAGGTGALVNAELSPLPALGDGAGAGAAPALGQVAGPARPGSAGLQPNLSGAEGPEDLVGESPSTPGAAYLPPGAAAVPVFGPEAPVSPDLGAAQVAPVSPSLGGSQPWGTAAGAPQGAGVSGVNLPGTGLTSAWDTPSSAAYGPAEPPSPALGDQLGTNLGLLAPGGEEAGTAEQALGGAGSGTGFEPSLISTAGSGTAAGVGQLPGAGSPSSPASPGGVVAVSSVSDPASPSTLGGAGGAPGALQPSLGAGPGVPPAAGEGAGEVAGVGGSLGQSQAAAGERPDGSGASDGEVGAVLQPASSSPSTEGSSSPGMAGEAANGASLPGAGGAGGGLSTGLEATGPEEPPVSGAGVQSGANLGLSDAKLSQADVVELPRGASVNAGPSPGASLGEGEGAITQIASGALAPSALASPQETQPLVPVAPDGSGVSDGMATSLATSLLLPGHGLSSGLAPNGDFHSAPGTQSGSRPLVPGAPGGLAGDAGGAQTWSLEDEVASGMSAPSGAASPHVPMSPNGAPVLPSAPQRENAAEGESAGPGLSTPLSTRESVVGSSAEGRGELGAAAAGEPALLLPPRQPGSPGAPSGDAESPVPGEASAMLPRVMAGRGDMARLLPSATGAGAGVETPALSPLGGSPGLPGLPPTRIAAGSPGSKTPGPGPAGSSSPATLQPFLGGELTTSLANRAPAAGGSSHPAAFSGQGGARGRSPATVRPAVSCSPAATSPAPPAPFPGGREALPRPGAATVTSRASSPVFPAPPGGPVVAPTLLPGPTVAAVPLYGYGARENDREYVERRVDFNSPLFKPETGFPFGKTLHDSLYFTDNGQIIFPASDNSIFTYPNPPPSGFNGHEEVPMIAVFWDNADFSRGVGTTFYQEFPTLNTAKPPFIRDVEAKVRRYLRSSYSAAWTLKITWEKAPAYAARTDTRRTITYQAVLTTDGFRSYVLMLYQEGGMRWDYTKLTDTNVLIGYTSGDGFYRNDDLTQRPPAAKYRPDQFRGYNTDLRGLWIYKLESRVGINYRLKCLAWTGRQQEPRVWSQGLPACPCSLQQGQQDPRFKSSRGGWWAARVSMLHSASPNRHGAGVRCLYDSQSQLIEGRQERYWRSSRQASPYRDQELKLYDWCCNQAGSARLCAHYSEKRPKIGCEGYQSPGTAGSSEEAESDSEEQRDGEDK